MRKSMNAGKQRKGSAAGQGCCYTVGASKILSPLFNEQKLWITLWKGVMQQWSLASFYPQSVKRSSSVLKFLGPLLGHGP